jgi:hypothetical protein
MADLSPIDPSLVPFQVNERVAFTEDHPDHPGMYGIVTDIGGDTDGALKFDLFVIDPFTGEQEGTSKIIYRAGMEDIQ